MLGSMRFLTTMMVGILLCLSGCGATVAPREEATEDPLRGVWVSYLDLQALLTNTAPSAASEALDEVMDICAGQGLNTVFFHVRSHSDAWYDSHVFAAADGAKPLLEQGFDPLRYAVEAAHTRGLELHAWVNPYRIGEDPSRCVTATDTRFLKNGVWYYNPAHPHAQQAILAGVREILTGYAVDGIHFDDYFYPDGMDAAGEAFEDIPAEADVTQWRRTQVNALVSAVYGLTRTYPACRFGISPAGTPAACEAGGADVTRWLRQYGYVDYLCPQMYFGFNHETKPFERMVNEWGNLPRHRQVALYGGLALYKAGLEDDPYAGDGRNEWAKRQDIIARQAAYLQEVRWGGFCLFRYTHLIQDTPSLQEERRALYARLHDYGKE